MDRLDAMRVFVRIVDLQSFTRAADELQLPRATVTHTIQQLEKRLGARLLHRTTRHVSATLDGEAYYQRCQQLLSDFEESESAFRSSAAKPRGKLRVDLQGTLAMHFLLPHIGEFFARYPDIELEIGLGDRLVDLVRESIDCVLRAGEPRESSMVGRRVALLEQVTCASAAYLEQFGEPRTPEEFRAHRAVNYASASGKVLLFEFMVDGERRTMQLRGAATVSHADAYAACCVAGLGFAQMPRYHVERELAAGTLREVLAEFRPPPMPVSVMYPHHRQLSPRVRVFVDWVADRMQRGG
ncbi:LysR family transcriptional regulator [Variovorax paradoxus]|nr:LysR family transcriptional regulator [Variovorax paradoxus]MBT2299958.1 LysR family transcriptional regulator [Variovorax paradoxus]